MAATTLTQESVTYRDAKGDTATVRFYILEDTALPGEAGTIAGNVIAAISALSNAVEIRRTGPSSQILDPFQYGATANYQDAVDKLRFTWLDAAGAPHRMDIPAPKDTAFLADQETASGTALANLITAMSAVSAGGAKVVSRDGSAFGHSLGGLRARRRFRRKLTLYSKSPNLDEPGE